MTCANFRASSSADRTTRGDNGKTTASQTEDDDGLTTTGDDGKITASLTDNDDGLTTTGDDGKATASLTDNDDGLTTTGDNGKTTASLTEDDDRLTTTGDDGKTTASLSDNDGGLTTTGDDGKTTASLTEDDDGWTAAGDEDHGCVSTHPHLCPVCCSEDMRANACGKARYQKDIMFCKEALLLQLQSSQSLKRLGLCSQRRLSVPFCHRLVAAVTAVLTSGMVLPRCRSSVKADAEDP